jgi:hypothetical protein
MESATWQSRLLKYVAYNRVFVVNERREAMAVEAKRRSQARSHRIQEGELFEATQVRRLKMYKYEFTAMNPLLDRHQFQSGQVVELRFGYNREDSDGQKEELEVANCIINLKGSVTNLKGSVTNLKGSVTNLKGSVTNLKGSVTNLKGSVTNLKGSVTKTNEQVEIEFSEDKNERRLFKLFRSWARDGNDVLVLNATDAMRMEIEIAADNNIRSNGDCLTKHHSAQDEAIVVISCDRK